MSHVDNIKNIVFSSGAMGGYAFIGVVRWLEENKLDRNIRGISGCSAGSIFALLFSLGYSYQELLDIGMTFKYKKYSDIKIVNFLEHCGLETGKKIIKLLSYLVREKTGMSDLTFGQHWTITGRELWINASCITTNKACYYSVKSSPNMSVLQAVRRSIGIPFLFSVCSHNGRQYIDGGFHDTIPACMFSPENTICFVIRNETKVDGSPDSDFIHFCKQLIMGMHETICNSRRRRMKKYRMVDIVTGLPPFTMNLSMVEKWITIEKGYVKCLSISAPT